MEPKICAIMAMDEEGGIGKNGKMAWHIPEDFKHFKEYTKDSLCIMGSTTFHDIASYKKTQNGDLLPDRTCIVLTRRPDVLRNDYSFGGVRFMSDGNLLKDIIRFSSMSPHSPLNQFKKICIIGGKSVYDLFFDLTDEIVVTRVNGKYDCDVKMDIEKYIRTSSEVSGRTLEHTPHTVEIYILEHELVELLDES